MSIKSIADNPKFWQLLTTIVTVVGAALGYTAVEQHDKLQELRIVMPEPQEQTTTEQHSHTPVSHSHKELAKEIKQVKVDLNQAIDETMNEHKERWH